MSYTDEERDRQAKFRETHKDLQPRYYDPDRTDLRRIPVNKSRAFRVSEMWDIHHEIARQISLGMKNKEIAQSLNVSERTVSNCRNSPVVQKQVGILRGALDAETIDLGIRIRRIAPKALDLIETALTTGKVFNDKVSTPTILKVAENHLDRAGYAPVRKFAGVTGTLTPDDIEEIKERARMNHIIAEVVK